MTQIRSGGVLNTGISDAGSIFRIIPCVEMRWRTILSLNSGIKPVIFIFGGLMDEAVDAIVEIVAV